MPETDHQHPLWKLLDALQMDARQTSARIVELRAQISQLELHTPEPVKCAYCPDTFPNQAAAQDHAYLQHDGPLPDHDRIANERAGDTVNA